MPYFNQFTAVIYKDTTETQLVDFSDTLLDLDFGTGLPGGFDSCTFVVPVVGIASVNWFKNYFTYHFVLYDYLGRRSFEGRIEDTELVVHGVSITVMGYYAHASDLTQGLVYPDAVPTSMSQIIEDCISLTTLWTDTTAFVKATTTDITPRDYAWGEKIKTVIEDVLPMGSDGTPVKPMHFAVWDYVTPHLFEEPSLSEPARHRISIFSAGGARGINLRISRAEIYNKIQAYFEDPDGGPGITSAIGGYGWQEDTFSQRQFGVREGTINVGQELEAVAQLVVDNAILFYPFPRQSARITLSGRVSSPNGVLSDIHTIRAGTIIEMVDFDPYMAQLIDVAPDAYSAKAFITGTRYSASSNTMELFLGTRTYAFEILMGQIGQATGIV